jgi:molecular chaperone DnaK
MTETNIGIDFGTTNSLASVVVDNRSIALVDQVTQRPHPSVIWYRGGDTVVGRMARENMDLTETGAPPGFVRSPKMSLRREGPIFVDGRPIEPTDAVAEVLRHIKEDAALARSVSPGHNLSRAVMTIPVDFGGPERRALREAAGKAGIGVVQFVHEPVAALYAHIRSKENIAQELARLEGRSILVFDWGGGTLDLTLCRIQGGAIMQVSNLGDNEVGGDRFDERLRNFLRSKHAKAHGIDDITALEQPGVAAKLLHQCETVKIHLSDKSIEDEDVIIRNYLHTDGPAQNLVGSITREELNQQSSEIVARGLARIDEILERSRLTYQDIELCLATGGMVNMPAIRDGLTERFLGRVPRLENGDRIISEGAAWIAHDGLRLTLSKPIEILVADTSGHGTYYPLVDAGWELPQENETQNVTNTRLFCTDPREGVAVVEIAKPAKLGRAAPNDPRRSLCVTRVNVDPNAQPLIERIECHLQIDHDYVAKVTLKSTGQGDQTSEEFHDLEFGLLLTNRAKPSDDDDDDYPGKPRSATPISTAGSNLAQRSNIVIADSEGTKDHHWKSVPGDLADKWKPNFFNKQSTEATSRQMEERNFYVKCAICNRSITTINREGRSEKCTNACAVAPLPSEAGDSNSVVVS